MRQDHVVSVETHNSTEIFVFIKERAVSRKEFASIKNSGSVLLR